MLFFFPQDVLDEILDLIESVLEGFSTYSFIDHTQCTLYCEYLLLPLQCYGGPIVFILILKFFVVASYQKHRYSPFIHGIIRYAPKHKRTK